MGPTSNRSAYTSTGCSDMIIYVRWQHFVYEIFMLADPIGLHVAESSCLKNKPAAILIAYGWIWCCKRDHMYMYNATPPVMKLTQQQR